VRSAQLSARSDADVGKREGSLEGGVGDGLVVDVGVAGGGQHRFAAGPPSVAVAGPPAEPGSAHQAGPHP